ncbi:hypothetical protein F66182_4324 [Fusarium sp. NRRL 66182]|nr:hypothetical protein F66182_4324 [Fusarium sp. NRRL 66182]
MKEVLVTPDLDVKAHSVPIPTPKEGQLLIKVIISGTNPKDWKTPKFMNYTHNPGDDIAGIVEAVGEGVTGFNKGDRVGAFHEMVTEHGSFAEYAIAWARTTFHLPDSTSFEEAATIPLAATTAALGVYRRLGLPMPWQQLQKRTPMVVYGGASAIGAFAIKFAVLSNVHPIIAIAGKGIPFVETLIDKKKGDRVIDYRKGDDFVAQELESIQAGEDGSIYAFDGVSKPSTIRNLTKLKAGQVSIAPVFNSEHKPEVMDQVPSNVHVHFTQVGHVHKVYYQPDEKDVPFDKQFGSVLYPFIGLGLKEGWFSGHPFEVVQGEPEKAIKTALSKLENNKVSAQKLLIKFAEA